MRILFDKGTPSPSATGPGWPGVPEDGVEQVELAAFFDGGHDLLLLRPPVPAAPRHQHPVGVERVGEGHPLRT